MRFLFLCVIITISNVSWSAPKASPTPSKLDEPDPKVTIDTKVLNLNSEATVQDKQSQVIKKKSKQ
jgi:hypothetical protein